MKKISSMGANTQSGINVDSIKNMGDAKLYDCIAENVKVMGEAYCEGCKFDKINCMGEAYFEKSEIGIAKVMGETEIKNSKFKELTCMGKLNIKDTARVDNLKIMGEVYADNLECKILSVGSKSGNFLGLFKVNKLINNGEVNIKGNIFGETFESLLRTKLEGSFRFNNVIFINSIKSTIDIECEKFYSFDKLNLQGINSEYIFIRPFKESKVKSLTGTNIMICRDFSITEDFQNIPKNYSDDIYEDYNKEVGILEVDIIEADDIYIENVNANCIRGQNIVIGKNCNIKRVEYIENIEISKDSNVNETIKEEL